MGAFYLYSKFRHYNFIMNSAQTKFKSTRFHQKNSAPIPYELSLSEEEVYHSNYMTKSIRLPQQRLRISLNRWSKVKSTKDSNQLIKNVQTQLNANINICGLLQERKKKSDDFSNYNPRIEEFETTADRMLNMRKRLSPMRKSKEDKRAINSVDAVREGPVPRASFLSIQKLNLIKIYSEAEKEIQSSKDQEGVEKRYNLSPVKRNKQDSVQNFYDTTVLDLKKTLRESYAAKWNTSKPRIKPFIAPFQRYYYKDFIWKIAFSNGLLLNSIPEDIKLKVYVGKGNNSQLVRSLLKRRNWWSFTERWQQANLVWTQLKINDYFNFQQSAVKHKQVRHSPSIDVAKRNQYNRFIMNQNDLKIWDKYWRENRAVEDKMGQDMIKRNMVFKKINRFVQISPKTIRIQNHLIQNFVIGNKKALLYTMRQYYESIGENVFDYLPLSFHVIKGMDDMEYTRFLGYYYEKKKLCKKEGRNNIWIVKPGQLTNRGNGIMVCLTLEEIKNILKRGGKHNDGSSKTFILQEYIEKPFLYQRRKFDIRHYILVSFINGRFKGYWFARGYIRTSSAQYTLNHGQAKVHLTNDAIQKYLPDYGRFEKGNKVSYEDFQAYLQREYQDKFNFFTDVYPVMKKIATDIIRASAKTLDPKNRQHNFQLFGLDFMIDENFRPWLIECNSNPCLELSCPLLVSIIPALIENTLKICVDSLIGPPADFEQKRPRFNDNALVCNEFELVYDSVLDEIQSQGSNSLFTALNAAELDREAEQEYEDDGEALED